MSSLTEPESLWLLLLPSLRGKVALNDIKNAYGDVIGQVLRRAAASKVTAVDIALPCIGASSTTHIDYSYLQNLLRHLYSVICLSCSELSIDVEYGNDVDVRVILLQDTALDNLEPPHSEPEATSLKKPSVTLRKLASSRRPWQRVTSIDSEDGERLLQLFLCLQKSFHEDSTDQIAIGRFAPESRPHIPSEPTPRESRDMESRALHRSVAVGGTFDHLHIGHKLLLSMTALVLSPEKLSESEQNMSMVVGITGDKLLQNKKFREHLQDWYQRQAAVKAFLSAFLAMEPQSTQEYLSSSGGDDPSGRAVEELWPDGLTIRYVEIFDPFGPTITEESITALVLSAETRAGGEAVNKKRGDKGWPALDVFEVDVLDLPPSNAGTSDEGTHEFRNKISSTEIRRKLAKKSGTAD